MPDTTDLKARLRKMAACVYIAVEKDVADDLADGLTKAIDALDAKDRTIAELEAEVERLSSDLRSCEAALGRRTEERNSFAERLRKAADDLRTVGDDYPGSSCHKWCHERAAEALKGQTP